MRMRKQDYDAVLAAYPRRSDARWAEEGGAVVVEVAKARGALGRRFLAALGAPATARAVLDGVGSDAWRLADGTRSVAEIARELVARHGAAAEPGEPRAVAFFLALRSRGLGLLAERPWEPPAGPAPGLDASAYRAVACASCGGKAAVEAAARRWKCPHCGRTTRAA